MTEDNQNPDATEKVDSESVESGAEAETQTVPLPELEAADATDVDNEVEVIEAAEEVADEPSETPAQPEPPQAATPPEPPAPAAPPAVQSDQSGDAHTHWPVEKDHGSVTRMLTGGDENVDMSYARRGMGRAFLNFLLLLLIFGVTGAGMWRYQYEASDTTLERKRLKREGQEEGHLRLQQKKQKKYGVLRVESTPDRALVRLQVIDHSGKSTDIALDKNDNPESAGTAAVAAAEKAKGVRQPKLTPMNIMNLDISKIYVITVEKEGYETDSFVVGGKHIWTKDATSGEYKFVKNAELFAAPCEYWFLYDAEKREEVRYPFNGECEKHYADATKRQVAVTECTCKAIVPGEEGKEGEEGEGADKDATKKTGAVPGKVKVVPVKGAKK